MMKKRGLVWVLLAVFLLLFSFAFLAQKNNFLLLTSAVAAEDVVNCGTADGCTLTTQEDCDAQGGTVIVSEEEETLCSPRCCKISATNFCEYGVTGIQCQKLAERDLGPSVTSPTDYEYQDLSQPECFSFCGGEELQRAQLTVIVKNAEGEPISGINVNLKQANTEIPMGGTDAVGRVTLAGITPGLYTLFVPTESSGAFQQVSISVSLTPGDTLTREVVLRPPGTGTIAGTVFCQRETGTTTQSDATVNWRRGRDSGKFVGSGADGKTGSDGSYRTPEDLTTGQPQLKEGTYNIFADAPGCGSAQITITLSGGETIESADITIRPQPFQGIRGKVTLNDIPIPGARLYVDDRFVRRTEPDGTYRITLPADGQPRTIYAQYAEFYQSDPPFSFLLNTVQPELEVPLVLERVGACPVEEAPDIQGGANGLTLRQLPGEEVQVLISWTSPNCPPEDFFGYEITRTDGTNAVTLRPFTSEEKIHTDAEGLEIGKTYTYTIRVIYGVEGSSRFSTGVSKDITLGDVGCFGETSFCPVEDSSAIVRCDEGSRDDETSVPCPENYVCGPGAEGEASCRAVEECRIDDITEEFFGDPFGLFYDETICYGANVQGGEEPRRFCTYDTRSAVIPEETSTDEETSFPDPRISTAVNHCLSCTRISSCFDYQTKDACEINSCRVEDCKWIDAAQNKAPEEQEAQQIVIYNLLGELSDQLDLAQSVSAETGAGYCVQEEYGRNKDGRSKNSGHDDQCNLCDPRRQPFEDYFCTAQVCSNLGRCFSTPILNKCLSCGEAPKIAVDPVNPSNSIDNTCYSYKTELECTGGKPISASNNIITLSADQCGWNRCLWKGTPNGFSQDNGCVKDGDANKKDDCTEDLGLTEGRDYHELVLCKQDNAPPKTKLLGTLLPQPAEFSGENSAAVVEELSVPSEGVSIPLPEEPELNIKLTTLPTVSLAFPQIVFEGDDSFHSKRIGEEDVFQNQRSNLDYFAYCALPARSDAPVSCAENDFKDPIKYRSRKKDTVIVSPLSKITTAVDGELYKLRYYSQDHHHNRESAKESFIFVDNVRPSFAVNHTQVTKEDTTWLTVWLEDLSEPMSCDFTLYQKASQEPQEGPTHKNKEEAQKVEFQPLPNVVAVDVNVSCTDLSGNGNSKLVHYTFDLEEKIIITSPKEFESSTTLTFAVDTTVEAECTLLKSGTNELIAPFKLIEEGNFKRHQTLPQRGFIPKEYAAEYKVVCDAFADIDNFEEYFHFTVDTSPPKTKITLREGTREVVPLPRVWEESFIASAEILLECVEEGIPCADVLYCTGDELSCPPLPGAAYQKYASDLASPLKVTESTRICYYSTDQAGNKVFSANCGKINIVGYGITLEEPEPHAYQDEVYGISKNPIFPWQFSAKVPTEECRFAFTPDFPYDDVPPFHILLPNAQGKYRVENFPSAVFQEYPNDGGEKTIFVRCKSISGDLSPEQKFILEYDPFTPTILQAYAEPATIYEGPKTHVFDVTDRKTLCKYSDNSEGTGSAEFASMEFSFPGFTEKILHRSHEDIFSLNSFSSPTGQKNYILNTQCVTGAGILSELAQITFFVDYAKQGFIVPGSLLPEGFVEGPDVPISVQTSKSADCAYRFNETYTPFTETGGTVHTALLKGLGEGKYTVPVKCTIVGGHAVEDVIKFTLDYTGPEITNVTDGTLTCGAEFINVFVYSTEDTVARYFYKLFDRGNQTTFLEKISLTNEDEDSIPYEEPLQIPTITLLRDHFYTVEVQGIDKARNKGSLRESDGVQVVSANHSVCLSDTYPPEVTSLFNETCSATQIEFRCSDAIGCKKFTYFTTESQQGCNFTAGNVTINLAPPPLPYVGQKISVERSTWICYKVEDMRGNVVRDQKYISFADADGDKVADSCDACSESSPGKIVNGKGCSDGDVPDNETFIDDDEDSLPGYWERYYDSTTCPLDETKPDSDDDGIGDGEEDYDDDGASNYQEFLAQSNPCLASDRPEFIKNETERRIKENKLEPPEPGPVPLPPEQARQNIVAWGLLIVGLLMIFGGTGYLVYYYHALPKTRHDLPPSAKAEAREISPKAEISPEDRRLSQLERGEASRGKAKKRRELFGAFDKASEVIPHIGEVLEKKAPVVKKLGEAAQKYLEHKEKIAPGLRAEEKNVFSQLEKLAKKTGNTDFSKVLPAEEAKDLFSELKELAKKRKQK